MKQLNEPGYTHLTQYDEADLRALPMPDAQRASYMATWAELNKHAVPGWKFVAVMGRKHLACFEVSLRYVRIPEDLR